MLFMAEGLLRAKHRSMLKGIGGALSEKAGGADSARSVCFLPK
jgi:hypothetical protein